MNPSGVPSNYTLTQPRRIHGYPSPPIKRRAAGQVATGSPGMFPVLIVAAAVFGGLLYVNSEK